MRDLRLWWHFFAVISFVTFVFAEDRLITADEAEHLVERASSSSSWWYANIQRRGTVPFNSNTSYVLVRNVMDYGAFGDGVHDDTVAINKALADGTRCKGHKSMPIPCESSTTQPAIVYFPPGVYLMSSPAVMYYNTIMLGDGVSLPTIKASASFNGISILDSNPYYGGTDTWWANQNNFYRQIRNLILDTTALPMSSSVSGIHWQVAQATSLQNLVFNMRAGGGDANKQIGLYMENGSGGFMRDCVFNGGGIGAMVGNQQFTASNFTFNNCQMAVFMIWDFIWAFRDLKINNCPIGISVTRDRDPQFGGVVISDTVFQNVTTGIITTYNCSSKLTAPASMTLNHVDFRGAKIAVAHVNGTIFLQGGSIVDTWQQGMTYETDYTLQNFPTHQNQTCYAPHVNVRCTQGPIAGPQFPAVLKDPVTGNILDRGKPTYDNYPLSAFISAKANGCKGDGVTDDSDCIQRLFTNALPSQVIFFDHGAYVVTKTIYIPPNRRIFGEGWALIMFKDAGLWSDMNDPAVGWRVGNSGEVGFLEMQDIVFETIGTTPGLIVMEWNLAEDGQATAGMWDVHWRIGGTAGTKLTVNECEKTPNIDASKMLKSQCIAAFLLLHITSTASCYLENNWGWVSDHELDDANHDQISIYNGRGLLVESILPVWIIGGSFEHSMLYNYQTSNARNVYMSHIQSEVAYMQQNPNALIPFSPNAAYDDPDFSNCYADYTCPKTWGLRIYKSEDIFIFAAGLYSFFINNDATCLNTTSCSANGVSIEQSATIWIFDLFTIGTTNLVSVDNTQLVNFGATLSWFGSSIALFHVP